MGVGEGGTDLVVRGEFISEVRTIRTKRAIKGKRARDKREEKVSTRDQS